MTEHDPLAGSIADALRGTVHTLRGGSAPAIVLYSGGLDSSLVAGLVREGGNTSLRTFGRPGATDLTAGRSGARLLGLPWTGTEVSDAELEVAWTGWGTSLASAPEPRRSVLFSLGVAFASSTGRTLWLGQGADELFGGYAHFEGLSPAAAAERARLDLDQLCAHDWPATLALAERQSVRLLAPFMEPAFAALVERVPASERFSGDGRKPLLRRVARALELPEELVDRPKKAMQYGSGFHTWVRDRGARDAARQGRA